MSPIYLSPGVFLTISLAAIMGAQGCAANTGGPFHVYDSPLLAGQSEPRYPRSRSFDPFKNDGSTSAEPAAHTAGSSAPVSGGARPDPAPSVAADQESEPADTSFPALSSAKDSTQSAADTSAERGASADAADYIWSVYALNGVEFSGDARRSVPALFRSCKERGKIHHASLPGVGDIVFFHNTADLNGDGRNNDWYTHAAIVESHIGDGRVELLGYEDGEIRRFTMNLNQPDAAQDRRGNTSNSQLRAPSDEDPPFTQYLAGQLFAGTCSALGEQSQFIIVDNWQPGMDLAP